MKKPLALLTGVGRSAGIAAGIARQLATDGWDLALKFWAEYDQRMPWAATPSGFQKLTGELCDSGADVMELPGNLELIDTPTNLFRAIAEAGKVPSALVLAHCESVDSGILDTTVESFDRHYAVNVRSSWQLIREFALHVPVSGGRIVALTSDHTVGNLPYGSTKAALDRIVLASAACCLMHWRPPSAVICGSSPAISPAGWLPSASFRRRGAWRVQWSSTSFRTSTAS